MSVRFYNNLLIEMSGARSRSVYDSSSEATIAEMVPPIPELRTAAGESADGWTLDFKARKHALACPPGGSC